MRNYKDTPKPQAASHMFWFFIIPALLFMGWASWTLLKGLDTKPKPESTLVGRVSEIQTAKSAGARYQAAYSLAQDIQSALHQNNSQLSNVEKDELFKKLGELLNQFPNDARLRRYLVLTLAQLKDPRSISIFIANLNDADSDIKFYSSWGIIEVLMEHPKEATTDRLKLVESWLKNTDPAYRKIATSYLVRFPEYKNSVLKLLKDENKEVQWNTAVALASQKDAAGKDLIKEMLELHTVRSVNFRSSKDLEQFVATALEATKNLGDKDLLETAKKLQEKSKENTTEGHALSNAFKTVPLDL